MGARNTGEGHRNHESRQGRVFSWPQLAGEPGFSKNSLQSEPDGGTVLSGNAPDTPSASDEDKHGRERKNAAEALANTLERIRQEKLEEERRKILDGTYPTRVIQGRQNKHIEGTREFEQKRMAMEKDSPGSEPSILSLDAQALVDRYKGTGHINVPRGSLYPTELVDTDSVVGKTWVKSLKKYVDTKRVKILYSSKGVHLVPVSDYERR